MAKGQVDPAHLQGEALTRWYLRSPQEIEAQRRQAAAQAYEQFFFGADRSAARTSLLGRARATDPAGSQHQLAAAGSARVGSIGQEICASCHGFVKPPAPVPPSRPSARRADDPWTYYPDINRLIGKARGSSRGEWSDRPQCNQQHEEDREICRKARSATCWENSNERLGRCNATGKVGVPRLNFGGR